MLYFIHMYHCIYLIKPPLSPCCYLSEVPGKVLRTFLDFKTANGWILSFHFFMFFVDFCFPQVLHRVTLDPEHQVTAVLPHPTPHLPPAFFNTSKETLDSLDFFTGASPAGETLDALDDLLSSEIRHSASPQNSGLACMRLDALDSLDSLDDFSDTSQKLGIEKKNDWNMGGILLDDLDDLDDLDPLEHNIDHQEGRNTQKPVLNELDSLDVLDTFPSMEGLAAPLDSLSQFGSTG